MLIQPASVLREKRVLLTSVTAATSGRHHVLVFNLEDDFAIIYNKG